MTEAEKDRPVMSPHDFIHSSLFTARELILADMLYSGNDDDSIAASLPAYSAPIDEQARVAVEKIRKAGFAISGPDARKALAAWFRDNFRHGEPAQPKTTYVYFIQAIGGGDHIKIGISENVASRLIDLQIASPLPLRVLGQFKARYDTERRLHEQFAAARLHGEWFRPCPEIFRAIDRLCRCGEAALTWPAYRDLVMDTDRPKMAQSLYEYVTHDPLVFYQPRLFKKNLIAERLHSNHVTVMSAFRWLVDRGYIVEHSRLNNVRRITVPESRERKEIVPPATAA